MTEDPGMTGVDVLAELARWGPFFALDSHQGQSAPVLPWRPFEELFGQPAALQARVAVVRAALAQAGGRSTDTVELRVAASMAQLGLAARLICPALGVAVLTGAVVDMDPAWLRWQPNAGGAVALSIQQDVLAAAIAAERKPAVLADALAATLLAGPVRTLVQASTAFGVSEQVLWGNVASVVNGAKALIGGAEPGLSATVGKLVTGLLNQPPLQGTHQAGEHVAFRRRSCCLVYRVAANRAPVCGDCVLDRAPDPARRAPARS
jgi:ferric iron reductase protein FhuF